MSVDAATLAAILAMAAITYFTRVAGLAFAARMRLSGRARAAFDAIPAAVLTAVIAPTAVATGWPETFAAVVAIVASLRLPLLATVAVGAGAVVAFRLLLG